MPLKRVRGSRRRSRSSGAASRRRRRDGPALARRHRARRGPSEAVEELQATRAASPPAGPDRARDVARRRRRHARRAGHGRLLLVPTIRRSRPDRLRYSASMTPAPARFRRRGPARAVLAADARALPRPSGSSRRSTRCPASARRSRSGSRKLGLERSATCSCTGRAGYERPAPSGGSPTSSASEEVVIAGVVRETSLAPRPRAGCRSSPRWSPTTPAQISRDLVQPALARRTSSRPGTPVRLRGPAEPLRLRRQLLRPERRRGDGRLRAGLPGERGDPRGEAARARRRRARARARRSGPAAGRR